MAAADIFLHPAYSENTGTVILEALSVGTPSIVSGVCGYAHYVKEAQAGFVTSEKFDQQEFNNCLRELVCKKDLRNLFSGRAKKYTEDHDFLSMPKYVSEILERDFLNKNK